jgi:S-DNA-T family DNA segregation ATPase FtsK/SpoIIIE
VSSRLTVTETIALLERLRGTLRDCAATEENLHRTFETNKAAAEKRFRDQIAAREADVTRELQRRESEFQTTREKLQASYQKRTAQISKAHKSVKLKAAHWITDEEGRRKYPLQRGVLDTQRGRLEVLKENDNRFTAFQQQLAECRETSARRATDAYKLFRGYPGFRRMLANTERPIELSSTGDEYQLLDQARATQAEIRTSLARYRKLVLPRLFRNFRLAWWIVLLAIAAGIAFRFPKQFNLPTFSLEQLGIATVAALALILGMYAVGKARAKRLATAIANGVNELRRLEGLSFAKAEGRYVREKERIETETGSRIRQLETDWRTAEQDAADARETLPRKVDEKSWRLSVKTDQLFRDQIERLEADYRTGGEQIKGETQLWKEEMSAAHATKLRELQSAHETGCQELDRKVCDESQNVRETLAAANRAAESDFPAWNAPAWHNWRPPGSFATAAKFAQVEMDLADETISAPLVLCCPQESSILFEAVRPDLAVIGALNGLILRFLATSPAGKASFTIIDPVKLGQNFAALMHLADYGEGLVNGQIWTESNQIEERLAELNAHMEKVIQNYLRNEYATIAEYNVQAGTIAEKYHFLVVADFPVNFSEAAIRRLLRIAGSGARCGVFTLIHWDRRQPSPHDALLEDLCKSSVCLNNSTGTWVLTRPPVGNAALTLDPAPDSQFTTAFLHQIGRAHRGSTRVEVPFSVVAPSNADLWTASTADELRVPIGRSGAAKAQTLAIGKGTCQHVLIAGKTGSGKSTLFHTIITNLALWCSPREVEFYLVDFKKGVEFKCYGTHRLPHARVVAIESDREFGLSVLQRVDEELRLRGELFRNSGVLDLAGYRAANPDKPMPRCLLIIDEFQEFFVEDDRISQTASVLLDRIVRQGRAFGIHVLLGSQTLGGAYTLARATLGQMVVRIALQCNEADAYLIMDENNSAPRLLSRPGEGIYNDRSGAAEANSPFQAVWLPDDERDLWLNRIRKLADSRNLERNQPIVFEGNAPADVRDNTALRAILESDATTPTTPLRIWLGASNSIKGATEVVFNRASGSNLLVVGQRDEAVSSIISLALIALAAQDNRVQCYVCGSASDSVIPGVVFADHHDSVGVLAELTSEAKRRAAATDSNVAPMFLFIQGLQNFRKLKLGDEFGFSDDPNSPAAHLQTLVTDGPALGIHVIATVDNYSNVTRFLGRKALADCEMRVLFQMSANDSASLCDDPKASTLGMHRALFYNEREGQLETFRPYAAPPSDWMQRMRQHTFRGRLQALPPETRLAP